LPVVDTEVYFKSELGVSTAATSPRGRQGSPRQATQKRRRTCTKTDEGLIDGDRCLFDKMCIHSYCTSVALISPMFCHSEVMGLILGQC